MLRAPARLSATLSVTLALLAAQGALAAEAGKIVFTVGNVQVGGTPAVLGGTVQEGDALSTGGDGYLYIKTVDEGLFILRPRSEAKIVTYHVDRDVPSRTQVKLELTKGVARSQSGQAVKAARQNFRFNTPVAAIGVRGTDFTVYTDHETSRVAVISGAVTMSAFGGGCQPDGTGPCGGAAAELSALQRGQLLEVRRGQSSPRLMPGGAVAPDVVAPPRSDEPLGKEKEGSDASLLDAHKNAALAQQAAANVPQQPNTVAPPTLPPPVLEINRTGREVTWGRWQAVYDKDANAKLTKAGADRIDFNETYVLFRNQAGDPYVLPERGTAGFALTGGEAYVRDMATQVRSAASIENGQLMIDFGNASYTTSIDLTHQNERYTLASTGKVQSDGVFRGTNQFTPTNNMSVTGALDNNNGATYLFQSTLRTGRIVSGVTTWGTPVK